MMTITEALGAIEHAEFVVPSVGELDEARRVVYEFASDMHDMVAALALVSFPIKGQVRIALDLQDAHNAIYITEETALVIHKALHAALDSKGLL